jgi:protease I
MSGDLKPLLIVYVGHPFVQQKIQEQAAVQAAKKAVIIVPTTQYADAELVDIQRVLKEAGITAVVASSKIGTLYGAFGGTATSEITFDKLKVEDFNAVIFIGGYGATEYFNNQAVLGIAREAHARNKVVAAISDATMTLANAGVLRGIRATGLPQQRDQLKKAGAQYTGSHVERDGSIITAYDSSVVAQFAHAIVTVLKTNQPKSDKTPAK